MKEHVMCLEIVLRQVTDILLLKTIGLSIDREKITDFSALRNICPSKALIVTGQKMSVSQIMKEIEKDIPFYQMSGGGVTLSGGEPFSQDPDLKELLIELKAKGIHVSVETSLHLTWETIEKYLDIYRCISCRS